MVLVRVGPGLPKFSQSWPELVLDYLSFSDPDRVLDFQAGPGPVLSYPNRSVRDPGVTILSVDYGLKPYI